MPNPQIPLTPAQLPEGTCYTTEQERLNGFAENLSTQIPDAYSMFNFGSTVPSADDRNKPWIRTNPSDGSLDGTYVYFDGTWKRKHPLDPGLIMLWTGEAAEIGSIDGGNPGVATLISGPFWEIDAAFAARFPVGVGSFLSTTAVPVLGTGGEEKHVLTTAELPESLGSLKSPYVSVIAEEPAGNFALDATNGNIRKAQLTDLLTGGSGTAHNTLPPYLGVFFVRRSIRIFYSI